MRSDKLLYEFQLFLEKEADNLDILESVALETCTGSDWSSPRSQGLTTLPAGFGTYFLESNTCRKA